MSTGLSGTNGFAEAVWQTQQPNKRGQGGTTTGRYTATTAGVTAAVWPPGLLLVLPVTAAGARAFRAAAAGAILGLITYLAGTVIWASNDLSTWWGIPPDDRLVWLAIGIVVLTTPKFVGTIINR